jgi:hypothetical protein
METTNLTNAQQETLSRGEEVDLDVDDTPCVLVRRDVWEKVKRLYDDSEWTEGELDALAGHAVDSADDCGPIE